MSIKKPFESLMYNSFSNHLKSKFGQKVYKIPIDAGFSCPNRQTGDGCLYCDPAGSGTGAHEKKIPVSEQIKYSCQRYREKYKAEKFIAYFQAFSNTNMPVVELKKIYDSILGFDDIIGLSIGTRPDCVDEDKIRLISSYSSKYYVWIEYGMQSANDKTLKLINRGHNFDQLKEAVRITRLYGLGINICLHVILGLPGESWSDMMNSAYELSKLSVEGLKLHLFHIVKGSPIEESYLEGKINIMDEQDYVNAVCDFLEVIQPEILIQRLTGERHPDILIAPKWCLNKNRVLSAINNELLKRGSYQGKKYKPATN